jgi:hypothetical protein
VRNENDIKPNLLQLESLRSELIEKTLNTNSNFLRLFLYQNYFGKTLSLNHPNLEEAFLKEFIEDYLNSIQRYEAFGTNPEFTDKLLPQLESLTSLTFIKNILPELTAEIERIKKQKEKLFSILEGKEHEDGIDNKAFFPLIDKEAPDDFYGIIESVTIRITKTTDSDKFIIVPSEKEIEKKISEQCKKSWLLAVDILKKYVKRPNQNHEVVISFDKKEGFYEGNSLGTSLTLSFLEELLKFYNPIYVIKIKERSAFTGGIHESEQILNVGEEVIKQKINAIFFSEINSFVIPKLEETYAYFTITQLKNQFPQRNLKLIPVENIYDVLNRRDLVEIKKINPVVRTGKFVKTNWVSTAIVTTLTFLLIYFFAIDFDHNPALINYKSNTLSIMNKNSKVLWNVKVGFPIREVDLTPELLKNLALIVDTDGDGTNEVIITHLLNSDEFMTGELGKIICFDMERRIRWDYIFKDTVYSNREEIKPEYGVMFVDTTTQDDKKIIWCCANNSSSFSSAIFALELRSGKRFEKTLWCCGHTLGTRIVDVNDDGEKEFIGVGIDNGLKNLVIWDAELDKLNGLRPTTDNYRIKNMDEAELLFYIRLPNTDVDKMNSARTSGLQPGTLQVNKENKNITFITTSLIDPLTRKSLPSIYFYLSYNLVDFDIYLADEFTAIRDSLVSKGKLNQPFTDTKEFKELLKSQILYYKDGEWVRRTDVN